MFPFRPSDLLDLSQCPAAEIFDGCGFVWEALPRIADFVARHLPRGKRVVVGRGTVIEKGAVVQGPAILGRDCRVRSGALVRENVIVGDRCVLGNSSEFKNALLFHDAVVPHFNYVGDSVLGYKAHLGAGVILSNLKLTVGNVVVVNGRRLYDTGLRKFGAILGDRVEIGCHAVLNPGSIIGRRALLYPAVVWRGVCPADTLVKLRQQQIVLPRRKNC